MKVKVTQRGPIFDGRARAAVDAYQDDAKRQVAQEGVNEVHVTLGAVLRNPTGYYESQIVTDRQSEVWTVTDGGVVYGPWLEGVSSRNNSTRFKGYATFRRVAQRLNNRAGSLAEQVLPKYLRRMQ
jgi:hypothetical protein